MNAAFALSLLAIASAAAAQAPDKEVRLGSRLPVKIDKRAQDAAQVREVHQRFGECVVKKHYPEAIAYLLNHPTVDEDDREGRKLVRKLADGACLVAAADIGPGGVVMTLPDDTMRYALSDTLVRREFAAAPLTDLDRVVRLAHPSLDPAEFEPKPGKKLSQKELAELAANRGKEQARIYLSQFGECVVRVDPVKSHALLMAPVNSPAESAAFAALKPRLGECVVEGRTLELNKTIVRGTVAYGYYRLAKAPRSAAPLAPGTPQ
ncbi:hypothetical protein [Sphingomonas sp.]|uniref:hypothetical protein n=1 Tax=Sphingomonas sp. TaxID=28214 RepID=UPI00286EB034|nr:hypothetical protein [Sphingomonas sp.]